MATMAELGISSVSYIDPLEADPELIGLLKKAIGTNVEDWNDYVSQTFLMRRVLDPDTLLFIYPEATFIAFEVLKGTSAKTFLNIVWSGGAEIKAALPEFNKLADKLCVQFDCEWIEMTGRVGWKRLLKPLGFNEAVVTMKREPAHVLRRREPEGNTNN